MVDTKPLIIGAVVGLLLFIGSLIAGFGAFSFVLGFFGGVLTVLLTVTMQRDKW
ncbi:MAG: hypothetical protein HY459_00050 [Parcubacteria group bacterium]|nr:hypothetical protein [Parcubacteria group bacterium]